MFLVMGGWCAYVRRRKSSFCRHSCRRVHEAPSWIYVAFVASSLLVCCSVDKSFVKKINDAWVRKALKRKDWNRKFAIEIATSGWWSTDELHVISFQLIVGPSGSFAIGSANLSSLSDIWPFQAPSETWVSRTASMARSVWRMLSY